MKEVKLFLDSGAYSVSMLGGVVDLDKYIEFVHKNKDRIQVYANLDVIGDGEASYKNWLYMRAAGLEPLPVYHLSTELKFLKLYMEQAEYIGLGGLTTITKTDKVHGFDRLWTNYLTDDKGYPRVKVHGFGIMAIDHISKYPWYSVDSTTWFRQSAYGSVFIPRMGKDGKYDYSLRQLMVSVSQYSQDRRESGGSFYGFTPAEQQYVLDYIASCSIPFGNSHFRWENADYEPKEDERWAVSDVASDTYVVGKRLVEIVVEEGVCNSYLYRQKLMIKFFLGLLTSIPPFPWPIKKRRSYFGLRKEQ